jgi:hypothetical protein
MINLFKCLTIQGKKQDYLGLVRSTRNRALCVKKITIIAMNLVTIFVLINDSIVVYIGEIWRKNLHHSLP